MQHRHPGAAISDHDINNLMGLAPGEYTKMRTAHEAAHPKVPRLMPPYTEELRTGLRKLIK
jgi:hypothetical protein